MIYYGKEIGDPIQRELLILLRMVRDRVLKAASDIIGYTVSIFVPGKEQELVPARYNLISDASWSKSKTPPKEDMLKEKKQQDLKNEKNGFSYRKKLVIN